MAEASTVTKTIVDGGFDLCAFVEAHLAEHVTEGVCVTVSAV